MHYTQQEHPPEKDATMSNVRAAHRMRDDLKAYQDGELPPLRRWWVTRHLEKCVACREEITVLQRLEREMQELERAVPRPQLRARILASLPDTPPVVQAAAKYPVKARPAFGTARRPMLAMGSACAVLLLMMGALALNHWQHLVQQGNSPSVATAVTPSSGGPLDPGTSLTNNLTNTDSGAPSATQSAEPAHALLDPFSPADSANGSPQASTTPSRMASDTTGTHSSRQSASATLVNVANVNGAKGEAYTDPTSREAEKLASRVLPDKLERERRNAGSPALQPDHFVQQASRGKNGIAETTQVAFAVADVSEARRQLQKWAEETGAKVTAVSSHDAGVGSSIESAGGVPASSGAVGPNFVEAAQAPTLLKIQVPAQQAERFKASLSDMGTPLLPMKSALRHLPQVAIAQDSMVETNARALTAPAAIDGAQKRSDSPGRRDAKTTVTIMVRLQACSPLPR